VKLMVLCANAKYNSDDQYICDLAFDEEYINIPHDIRDRRAHSRHGWREGESVYTFVREASGNGLLVKPFFQTLDRRKNSSSSL